MQCQMNLSKRKDIDDKTTKDVDVPQYYLQNCDDAVNVYMMQVVEKFSERMLFFYFTNSHLFSFIIEMSHVEYVAWNVCTALWGQLNYGTKAGECVCVYVSE
jgi:hypothetical protein